LIVGWRLTKLLIAPAETSMTATETITAAIITPSWSTMPTAVITESSENTASRTTIWATTAKEAVTLALACPESPSRRSWIS
jgi:hypothetical protein